ncbi:MAG TPA: hypothetical protein VF556_09660 [Pyrinomonadaceae bacterium]|jgi:hypothetical protein
MKTLKTTPRKSPLILIIIVTSILAIPGFAVLLDQFTMMSFLEKPLERLPAIIFLIAGFILFAGYIWTAISGRHNRLFWLFSTLYNLAQTGICFLTPSFIFFVVSLWTIFVMISSIYYFSFANKNRKQCNFYFSPNSTKNN